MVEYVTYEVVEDQAEVVRRVFRMYSEGSSYKKVAHALNTEGIRSPGGSTWDTSGVRTLLLNENYLGHRVWNQTRRNKKLQRGTKVPKPREASFCLPLYILARSGRWKRHHFGRSHHLKLMYPVANAKFEGWSPNVVRQAAGKIRRS